MDAEQMALGTFSPIEGFMSRKELESVMKDCRLPNGVVWPLPITLQVDERTHDKLKNKESVVLASADDGEAYALLHIDGMYKYDLDKIAASVFGTNDIAHPGVKYLKNGGPYFVGGKVDLLKRLPSKNKYLEITPRQARAIFENKGWTRVVGFHTRNVIHRAHEHIQKLAVEKYNCDGIFIHPVVGPKKEGDYREDIILKTYELMMEKFYPSEKTVLGAFQSYSRYAGPREAVFTALCRKNFGCSHFIVGRDHTGVGTYYKSHDVKGLFDSLGDIGITPVFFNEINYCRSCDSYTEKCLHGPDDISRISGSDARSMLKSRRPLPGWFMRPEISRYILDHIKNDREVFVK